MLTTLKQEDVEATDGLSEHVGANLPLVARRLTVSALVSFLDGSPTWAEVLRLECIIASRLGQVARDGRQREYLETRTIVARAHPSLEFSSQLVYSLWYLRQPKAAYLLTQFGFTSFEVFAAADLDVLLSAAEYTLS